MNNNRPASNSANSSEESRLLALLSLLNLLESPTEDLSSNLENAEESASSNNIP